MQEDPPMNLIWIMEETYPKFIILESKEELALTKLSPFIIQKTISSIISPKLVKNLKNRTILTEVSAKKQAEILLKLRIFLSISINTYPHERLNTSRGAGQRLISAQS